LSSTSRRDHSQATTATPPAARPSCPAVRTTTADDHATRLVGASRYACARETSHRAGLSGRTLAGVSKAWASGSTAAWRRLRAAVLAENERVNRGACQAGVPGVCTGGADQVHHTLGRGVTGDDPRYLQAVCGACNRAIGEPGASSPAPRPVTKW
jgi:hypothetical protein